MSENKQIKASDLPYRPIPIKIINGMGRLLNTIGIEPVKLDRDTLIAKAKKKTGFSDFDDEDYLEGLDRLIRSLKEEAELTFLGKVVASGTIVDDLVHRLEVIEWRKRHPKVADEEIRKPLFINGLPRTGTTILYGLLDVDPANRSPISWEVDEPIPPSTLETRANDTRIEPCRKKFDGLHKLAPGIEAVHPMGADLPQECVAIFSQNFKSESYVCLFDIPSYTDWIDSCSYTKTFEWHKKYLQHMQSGGVRGDRWLLKSPQHLHILDYLLEAYPDANIVHTHRNPIDVCLSCSSLFAILRSMSSDKIDCKHIGRQSLDWWEKLVFIGMEQRKRHADKPEQFIDIKFNDLIADPIQVVERIYDHFGYELKTSVKNDMVKFMEDNSRDKHGSHSYTDEEFGIDRKKDEKRFSTYCKHFGIE